MRVDDLSRELVDCEIELCTFAHTFGVVFKKQAWIQIYRRVLIPLRLILIGFCTRIIEREGKSESV